MVHKLKISCGMMLGVYMRGVIRLMSKNPAAAPFWHFHFTLCYLSLSHTLLASSSVLVCLCMVYFLGFFSGIFCECVSRICSRNSIIITVWIVIGPSSCSIATAMACPLVTFSFFCLPLQISGFGRWQWRPQCCLRNHCWFPPLQLRWFCWFFWAGVSLCGGHDPVYIIQGHGCLIVLSHDFLDFSG